jgi:hypothetical protein
MMTSQQEPDWVVDCRNRAREEGLSVVDGNIWYRNPAGLNGAGSQFSGAEQTGHLLSYAGRIQDVGLCERIKVDGKWREVCIALGQVLRCFSMPIKRYGLTENEQITIKPSGPPSAGS